MEGNISEKRIGRVSGRSGRCAFPRYDEIETVEAIAVERGPSPRPRIEHDDDAFHDCFRSGSRRGIRTAIRGQRYTNCAAGCGAGRTTSWRTLVAELWNEQLKGSDMRASVLGECFPVRRSMPGAQRSSASRSQPPPLPPSAATGRECPVLAAVAGPPLPVPLPRSAGDAAVGAFLGALVAADPEVLRAVGPSDAREADHNSPPGLMPLPLRARSSHQAVPDSVPHGG